LPADITMDLSNQATLRKIRCAIAFFIFGLVLSGITSFPLQLELNWLASLRGDSTTGFDRWIRTVRDGLNESYARHSWIAYGTDWLAFAHLVIAIFFIGAWIDPVRNIWIIHAGLLACALVIPLALICGPIRGVPFGWRLIDSSFGVIGAIPLLYAARLANHIKE